MKKRSYILTTIVLATAALGLSSCLKDNNHFVDFSNVGTLVELPLEAFNGPGVLVPEALPIQATPQTIAVVVNVASPKPLGSALSVTLAIDQAALDAYNTANGLSGANAYVIPPSNAFSIGALTVTVPANQRTANLNVTVNTANVDPAGKFVIPISIVSASGQKISNYKTVLLNVQAKNKYDGEYAVTGTMVDNVNPALTGYYPEDIYLETTGANTVAWYDAANGFLHLILNGGSLSAYGSFSPVFTFDPTTNNVTTVTNHFGQPAGNTRSARIDPSGLNTFTGTPGTAGAVLNVKYIMVQTSTGGDRTFFNETLKYVGPRP